MKQLKLFTVIGLLSIVLWLPALPASAYTTDVITASGTLNGLPVSVSVQFITSDNTVEVKIWNNIANPTSDIQCLSGLSFVLSTGETSGSIISYSATARAIDKTTKTYTDVTPATSSHWILNSDVNVGSAGSGLELSDLSGGKVTNTIIGPPDSTNKYSAANNSITNANHEPVWYGTAANPVEFFLQVDGVTDSTAIVFVQFAFGTSGDAYINDDPPVLPPTPTPIPGSVLLLGSGLLALALLRLNRKAVDRAKG